jgi:3-phenylpropionate/cinnamic acid dioxygenase small subunit
MLKDCRSGRTGRKDRRLGEMLSVEEMSDRLEIEELLFRYSHAIDSRNFEALRDVFTEDAFIDYSEMGGSKGDLDETISFLGSSMALFASFQHAVSNILIDFASDRQSATVRSILQNPMVLDKGDGETHVFFCGLWYNDKLVRTPAGWRIKERSEEKSYFHNVPTEWG